MDYVQYFEILNKIENKLGKGIIILSKSSDKLESVRDGFKIQTQCLWISPMSVYDN